MEPWACSGSSVPAQRPWARGACQVPGLAPCSWPWDEQARQAARARPAGHTWSTPGAHTWSTPGARCRGRRLEVRAAPAPEQGFAPDVLCLQCQAAVTKQERDGTMRSSSCCHAFVQQLKASSEGFVEALFALVFFCSFFKYRLKRAGDWRPL